MARKGFKVLDSDMHIIEPPDLWQRYIDPEFKDQAPRGLTETVGDLRLIGPDGKPWGRDAVAVRDQQRGRGQSFAQNQIRFKPYEERGWTGEVQLGAIFSSGACTSPVRSQCSSIRHIRKGNHEQFPSRKAARRLGWRSRMPPPQKLAAAIICSTGWQKTCRSMPFDPNCSPTWRSCDPAPSWKPTGTPNSSRVDHRGS